MNYDLIIEKAVEFVRGCHKGQKRKSGDYVEHPIAAMKIAVALYEEQYEFVKNSDLATYMLNKLYVALLTLGHDAAGEDVARYKKQ